MAIEPKRFERVNIFDKALRDAGKAGIKPRQGNSINWFRNYIKGTIKTNPYKTAARIRDAITSSPSSITVGRMYMFAYDAKHKDKLPYWDAMPLIFPFWEDQTSIYGLNLYYLPPILRAKALDVLYQLLNNKNVDISTRLKLSYNTLRRLSEFDMFKPCVKQYLKSNIKSLPLEIPIDNWETALFLPVARWQNSGASSVYTDSMRIASGKGKK